MDHVIKLPIYGHALVAAKYCCSKIFAGNNLPKEPRAMRVFAIRSEKLFKEGLHKS